MSFGLFSSLDFFWCFYFFPSYFGWIFSMSWLLLLIFSSKIINRLHIIVSRFKNLVLNGCYNQETQVFKGSLVTYLSMFWILFLRKIWGLNSYCLSWTSHILVIFGCSFVFYLVIKISGFVYNFVSFYSHLVPVGSPLVLAPLLSLIELISSLVRPLTLTLRLGINITAGHIFLSLLRRALCYCFGSGYVFLMLFIYFIGIGYCLFEIGVGFIQGFVYCLLLGQFTNEHTI